MIGAKPITEETTLGELNAQCLILGIVALRLRPALGGDVDDLIEATAHHATGLYVGMGLTEAAAIEAAFAKLRRATLPDPGTSK